MTDDTMALRTLLEKSPDADFLRDMIGFAAERLMELEVGGLDRRRPRRDAAPQRLNQRNGYRDQDVGDARRHRRTAHPEAAEGLVLSGLPRTAPAGREGAHRRDPGSLCAGRVDPLGR